MRYATSLTYILPLHTYIHVHVHVVCWYTLRCVLYVWFGSVCLQVVEREELQHLQQLRSLHTLSLAHNPIDVHIIKKIAILSLPSSIPPLSASSCHYMCHFYCYACINSYTRSSPSLCPYPPPSPQTLLEYRSYAVFHLPLLTSLDNQPVRIEEKVVKRERAVDIQ